ncbi:MAG: type IV secretion system DNA-binding domain-containing protein [Sphingomonadaceae bacterium]
MSRDRDNLLRGQGKFKQGIAGLAVRWRAYAWTVAGSGGFGAFLLASHDPAPGQFACAYQHAQGVAVSWIASGRSDPEIAVRFEERTVRVPASVLANDRIWLWCWDDLVGKVVLGGTLGALVGLLLCFGFAVWIRSEGKEAARDRFISGTQIVTERVLARMTRKATNARSIRIASVGIPAWLECRHFALLGTTGAGKTTVMRQMLDQVEARGEPALVYDTSGEFITHYYRPERGDIILNPFDERSSFWSPFSEIAHPADADRIARQLVSETGERDDDVWLETSRILVANILRVLSAEGRTTLPDLLDALQVKGKEEMKVWLAGTSSARTFAFREFIAGLDARQGPKPWLFVPRKEDYFEAMKPLLACWLECAASAMLGLPPSDRRRMWFFLDELADLPRVDNLTRLLPEGRKFGASVVLTFQAIGQMHRRYGRGSAEALLGCCNSKLYLQLIDRDTREWASRNIGDVEVEVRSASDSFESGPHSGRTSVGSTRVVRPAVIESDLRLQPHHGFLQLPDALPVGRIKLTREHIDARGPARHPAFVPAHISRMLWNRMPKKADSGTAKDDPDNTLKGPV